MKTVNIYEAKTHLSRLIEEVESGAEVLIARSGRPVARLVPLVEGRRPVRYGVLKGRIRIRDDFDSPLPDDLIAGFEGR